MSSNSLLRNRKEERASVSYSELLFDLIYVFAVTQLSHYLLHHLSGVGFVQEIVLWFGVWLAWQHTTWVTNWFNPELRSIRVLLFVLMVLGLVMAAAIPEAYERRGMVFAFCYVAIQLGRTVCILFLLDKQHHLSPNFKRIFGWFCISAVFWVIGAFQEGNMRILFWAIGVVCDYTSPMFGFYIPFLGRSDAGKEWNIEGQHLAERSQLFVIIAFGETILTTGASFSEIEAWSLPVIISTLLSFVGSLAMWWVYFDVSSEVGSMKIKNTSNPGLLGLKYHSIHVILVGALIVCAVGDELAIDDPTRLVSGHILFVMIAGPIFYLASNLVYKWMISHCFAWSHVVAISVMLLTLPFAGRITLVELNGLITLLFILVVIYETYHARCLLEKV